MLSVTFLTRFIADPAFRRFSFIREKSFVYYTRQVRKAVRRFKHTRRSADNVARHRAAIDVIWAIDMLSFHAENAASTTSPFIEINPDSHQQVIDVAAFVFRCFAYGNPHYLAMKNEYIFKPLMITSDDDTTSE